MERRKFLTMAVTGAGAVAGGVVAIPSLISAFSPVLNAEEGEPEWRLVGSTELFPAGEIREAVVKYSDDPSLATIAVRSIYVWRQPTEEYVVYSRACTDLGCPVNYDPGSEWFYCPCHGGIFDKEGERRAGPPKKPLWRYAWRVRDGMLEIDLRSVPAMA